MLAVNTTLKGIDFNQNGINSEGVKIITQTLTGPNPKNTTLQFLGLGSNTFDEPGFTALAKVLETNPALTQLDLNWCQVSQPCAFILADVLTKSQYVYLFFFFSRLRC